MQLRARWTGETPRSSAAQLVAGGRGGKERAARYERSCDWPGGGSPPAHVTNNEPYGAP